MDPLRIWFDPPHVRWGRVVATVLVVTVLVALWVAQRRGLFDATAPQALSAASAPAAPRAASGAARTVVAVAPAAGSAPLAAAVPARAASAAELVCGLGAIEVDPANPKQQEQRAQEALARLEAHADRVMPGWLEEMKSNADVQVQAAAWLLETRRAWLKRLGQTRPSAPLDSLDELIRLAERSRDPLPYALAFQACALHGQREAAPACASLRAEAWAERDPGNAFPWLAAAGTSQLDTLRRAQYIERALAADALRSSWGALHAVMAKAAPPREEALDRSARFFEAASADATVAISHSNLVAHCSEAELRQGARRQQCERLATFLTERSDSLLMAGLGQTIGRRLGWSEDRLQRLTDDLQSLQERMPADGAMSGCDGLARAEAYFADVAKYGEIGALRRRPQTSATAAAR
jgi:hypothetical protein